MSQLSFRPTSISGSLAYVLPLPAGSAALLRSVAQTANASEGAIAILAIDDNHVLSGLVTAHPELTGCEGRHLIARGTPATPRS